MAVSTVARSGSWEIEKLGLGLCEQEPCLRGRGKESIRDGQLYRFRQLINAEMERNVRGRLMAHNKCF